MNYEAIAEELREPKYQAYRDDPETCIAIMKAEKTEIYTAFDIGRWSEDIQQRGSPQGLYMKNLNDNKDSTKALSDGRTLGEVCSDILNAVSGNTLSNRIDYEQEEIRTNMDNTLTELVGEGVFDLRLMGCLRAHGVTESNKWEQLGSPNEGDILTAWELVP